MSPELFYPASREAVIFGCVPFILCRYTLSANIRVLKQYFFYAPLNASLTENLNDISLRYNTTSSRPEWKERGADTWNPFSSEIEDVTTTVGVLNPQNYYKFNVGVSGKYLWVCYNIYPGDNPVNTDLRLNFEFLYKTQNRDIAYIATINIEEPLQTQASIQLPDLYDISQLRVLKY